jgi:hypothetical protein
MDNTQQSDVETTFGSECCVSPNLMGYVLDEGIAYTMCCIFRMINRFAIIETNYSLGESNTETGLEKKCKLFIKVLVSLCF